MNKRLWLIPLLVLVATALIAVPAIGVAPAKPTTTTKPPKPPKNTTTTIAPTTTTEAPAPTQTYTFTGTFAQNTPAQVFCPSERPYLVSVESVIVYDPIYRESTQQSINPDFIFNDAGQAVGIKFLSYYLWTWEATITCSSALVYLSDAPIITLGPGATAILYCPEPTYIDTTTTKPGPFTVTGYYGLPSSLSVQNQTTETQTGQVSATCRNPV